MRITENSSRYYGLSLSWTLNPGSHGVRYNRRVDCISSTSWTCVKRSSCIKRLISHSQRWPSIIQVWLLVASTQNKSYIYSICLLHLDPNLKRTLWFLANDVTKVTSWLMSKTRRTAIYAVRYICLRLWSRGGFWRDVGWGCATGTLKSFLSAAHAYTAYTMGVRPQGFEVFCDQQELFNVTSNAL